ncbi:MAG: COX15/CtaA family protein [Halieaceae bacterium]|jgi:cytochrome c oxidase assembly protein subunit 15|nr:COX15/CtaA family protein [Halieaceae bacterium]
MQDPQDNTTRFFSAAHARRPSFRLALFGVCFAMAVIILGAFTRLVDAGLGCPDWPGCYGHVLWPTEQNEIAAANQAYPDAPVELDKTWPEMVHRYLATTLGAIVLVLAALAVRYRGPGQPLRLPLFLLGFVILQGMFGMWTVTLKLWPQVVTAHLLGGFTTISLLWLLVLRLNRRHWRVSTADLPRITALRPLALAALLVVIGQIALGGWTTSNYAAVACPDLPTCQGRWLPSADFAAGFDVLQQVGPNYLGGTMTNEARVAIHLSHRLGALVTLLVAGLLALRLLRDPHAEVRRLGVVVGTVLTLQFLLGLSNILFQFPVLVATAHNAVGALLLLSMVTVNFYLATVNQPLPALADDPAPGQGHDALLGRATLGSS